MAFKSSHDNRSKSAEILDVNNMEAVLTQLAGHYDHLSGMDSFNNIYNNGPTRPKMSVKGALPSRDI